MTITAKFPNGSIATFDGDQWATTNQSLLSYLQAALDMQPRTHVAVLDLAKKCLAGLDCTITAEGDEAIGEDALEDLEATMEAVTTLNADAITDVMLTAKGQDAPATMADISFTPDALLLTYDGEPLSLPTYEDREDVRLHELNARWYLWKENLLPESVAENPQALSEADAVVALENHLETMKGEVK